MTDLEFAKLVRHELELDMRQHPRILQFLCSEAYGVYVSTLSYNILQCYSNFINWVDTVGQELYDDGGINGEYDRSHVWSFPREVSDKEQNEFKLRKLNERIKELEESE